MPRSRSEAGAEHWHSLLYFNCYRLIVALVLLGSSVWLAENIPFGHVHRGVFVYVNLIYIGLTAAAFAPILWRQPAFHLQLSTYVGLDIVAVTLMIYASGGVTSGLGLLLLPSLAAAGLMAMGHLTLFYAAVASIGILGEQLFGVVFSGADSAPFLQAGL
ncbi:MAG: hypothetical protein PVI98_13665, partial [Burkholderiales bacterium]